MLSKFQTIQCENNTQFEVCYWNDLTLTADKHLLNNESEMCVGPTADSPLNTLILVLMKNPRDVSQLQCLARQAFLGRSGFLHDAYKDATSQAYGYLVLHFSPSGEEEYRVRTKVFPGEDTVVYRPI